MKLPTGSLCSLPIVTEKVGHFDVLVPSGYEENFFRNLSTVIKPYTLFIKFYVKNRREQNKTKEGRREPLIIIFSTLFTFCVLSLDK